LFGHAGAAKRLTPRTILSSITYNWGYFTTISYGVPPELL
jgi:hypothetical protein